MNRKRLSLIALIVLLGAYAMAYGAPQEGKAPMERTEKAEQTYKKWRGSITDPLLKTDPELAAISNNMVYGEILSTGSLADPQKALVILAALTASQGWDEIPDAVRAALAIGATPLQIREALYQCAPYVGMPRVKKALALANAEFAGANVALPLPEAGTATETTRFNDGLALQKKIFGAEPIENMQKNAPANQQRIITTYLSAWCFGDFYTRDVLDLKMRELITFSAIVALGGCNPQAQAHTQANLNVGNSADDLLDALAVMLPFIGYPRTLNALGCVNTVLGKK